MKRILVASDLSARADGATKPGLKLARLHNASSVVHNIINQDFLTTVTGLPDAPACDDFCSLISQLDVTEIADALSG